LLLLICIGPGAARGEGSLFDRVRRALGFGRAPASAALLKSQGEDKLPALAIWRVKRPGGEATRLTRPEGYRWPVPAPDGSVWALRGTDLMQISRAGEVKPVLDLKSPAGDETLQLLGWTRKPARLLALGNRGGVFQIATQDRQVERLGAVSAEEAEKLRLATRTCRGETVSAGPREEGPGGASTDRIRLFLHRLLPAGRDGPVPLPVSAPLVVALDGVFTPDCREILMAAADSW
jgi:hypothetical protein